MLPSGIRGSPIRTVESAPEASRCTLKQLEGKFGKVLNIHGAMAHSPVVRDAYAAPQHSINEAHRLHELGPG